MLYDKTETKQEGEANYHRDTGIRNTCNKLHNAVLSTTTAQKINWNNSIWKQTIRTSTNQTAVTEICTRSLTSCRKGVVYGRPLRFQTFELHSTCMWTVNLWFVVVRVDTSTTSVGHCHLWLNSNYRWSCVYLPCLVNYWQLLGQKGGQRGRI